MWCQNLNPEKWDIFILAAAAYYVSYDKERSSKLLLQRTEVVNYDYYYLPRILQATKCFAIIELKSEVGIYKRKEESKKTRKQKLDQESDQEKRKTRTRPRKRIRKQELDQEKMKKLSFLLDHFLSRVLVFLYSHFLVFFYKFPPLIGFFL